MVNYSGQQHAEYGADPMFVCDLIDKDVYGQLLISLDTLLRCGIIFYLGYFVELNGSVREVEVTGRIPFIKTKSVLVDTSVPIFTFQQRSFQK